MKEFGKETLDLMTVSTMETLPTNEPGRPHENEDFILTDTHPTYVVGGRDVHVGANKVRWTLEIPEDPVYDGIVYFASGYGAIKSTSGPYRRALAERGFATVTVSPARRRTGSIRQTFTSPQEIHTETIGAVLEEITSSNIFHKLSPETQNKKNVIVTHSMGGLAAPGYALKPASGTEAIINIAAAGYGSPRPLDLLADVPKGLLPAVVHEILPAVQRGNIQLNHVNILRMARHILRSPAQTLAEGLSCLRQDVREDTRKLKEAGVKIGYIALQHDMLVRPNPDVSSHVDEYKLLDRLGHLAPQKSPQIVAHQTAGMLKKLGVTN